MSVIRSENQTKVIFDRNISNGYVIFKKTTTSSNKKNNLFNEEQTEYYNYYSEYDNCHGTVDEWIANYKIIFGKKEIKVISSYGITTYIIMGNPKYDKKKDCTIYNVYWSEDAYKYLMEIERYKDKTTIPFDSECGGYSIYLKNKP